MLPRVLVLVDPGVHPRAFEPLESVAEVTILPPDRDTLLREIVDSDGYIPTLGVRVDREVLDLAKKLKAIATPSTGLDHIDLAEVEARGIQVLSLKDDRSFLDQITATAELAWVLMLAVVRRLPAAFEAARQGHWARDELRGHQMSGKTFGILGYGRLGTIVGQYAKAFRFRVLACDVEEFEAEGIERVDMETLFRESDVVSLHVHLTPENRGLVGKRELGLMKEGAVLINTSRGAIVDEEALLEALESGRLGGAGLDVIHGEWSADLSDHPLIRYAREHENLVITPHLGGVTYESQELAYRHTAEKLRDFLLARSTGV